MIRMLPSTFCRDFNSPATQNILSNSHSMGSYYSLEKMRCASNMYILHPNWQLNTPLRSFKYAYGMVAQFAKCADIRNPVNQCQSTKIRMTCVAKNKKENHLRKSNNQGALAERNAASAASRAMRTFQSLHLFKCRTPWPSWMVPLTISLSVPCFVILHPRCRLLSKLLLCRLRRPNSCVPSGFYCDHFCQVPHII